jgi:hypothetical protein
MKLASLIDDHVVPLATALLSIGSRQNPGPFEDPQEHCGLTCVRRYLLARSDSEHDQPNVI